MQVEGKHKALDQSSQARADPDASKQCSDSFPQISHRPQQMQEEVLLVDANKKLSGSDDVPHHTLDAYQVNASTEEHWFTERIAIKDSSRDHDEFKAMTSDLEEGIGENLHSLPRLPTSRLLWKTPERSASFLKKLKFEI
jgi:hypothetical protein